MSGERGTGVAAARAFEASAVHCGIRSRPDLALVVSSRPASAAAVFTRNRVRAAPITVSRRALRRSGGRARAIVVNSGNANACTGRTGLEAASRTAREAARLLELPEEEVLVASTGVIGVPLPVDRLLAALPAAAAALSPGGAADAAAAILTTDTRPKETARRIATPAGRFAIGGMAKGSGMIHPDLATTLAFVTTDAAVPVPALRSALRRAVDRSFNRVTVDGDTSTNDMVAVLANGASGVAVGEDLAAEDFEAALTEVLVELAREVARDGEGATRLITVSVSGAADDEDALKVARTVAGSPLVKTAVYGADANWGRIAAAAGRSGARFDPERLAVRLNGLAVLEPGFVSDFAETRAAEALARPEVVIAVDLGAGSGQATTWTCDLGHGYIDINASYRT